MFLLVKIEKMRQFHTFEFSFREMLASFYPFLGHSSANSLIFEKIKVPKTKKPIGQGLEGEGGGPDLHFCAQVQQNLNLPLPPSPLPFGFDSGIGFCFFGFSPGFSPNQCSSRLLDCFFWFLAPFIFPKMNELAEE